MDETTAMVQVVSYDNLESLPSACQGLFSQGAAQSIFLTSDWFGVLSRFGLNAEDRPFYLVAQEPSGVVRGILPLRDVGLRSWRHGQRVESLANYYSSLYAPLLATQHDQISVLVSLLSAVTANHLCDCFDLYPLAYDESLEQLKTAMHKADYDVQTYFRFGNWYLTVAGRSWSEYQDQLPSQLKNTLRRKTKQLLASGATLELVCQGERVESAIQAYQQVYGLSWKQVEPHPQFMPELIRMAARMGWLRLGLVWWEGKPIAAQVWFVCRGIASIYKLAYDESHAKWSAGSVLTAFLMAHVLDVDKVSEVDYLTGDDGYKKDWMSGRRERWGLVGYNRKTIHGRLQGCFQRTGKMIQRWRATKA